MNGADQVRMVPMPRPDAAGRVVPKRRSARRVAAGAVLGALMALVTVALQGGSDQDTALVFATDGVAGTGSDQSLRAPVHSCLTWQQQDGADARLVNCAEAHLFEVTGTVELDGFDAGVPFPDDVTWQQLVISRCTERTTQALAGRFDPFGRFTVGAIKPSADSWQRGDRTLRCGVQAAGRSGVLFPTTGTVSQQDQSDVHPPGTCLGNDGKAMGDPVDCAGPHAVEVVGVVDLSGAFPDGYPEEAAQDEKLDAECTRLAAEFAGGPAVIAEKRLTLFWETLRPESWQVGSTRVDCRLGAFLPDRSGFAPVTGSVRGPVQVGTEPAAPAPRKPGAALGSVGTAPDRPPG
ncbi:MAG TPA: septum formation family protein, partial [Pseudonocardiaceae bacterium]|nr:septum formation family protein [Pseudonocardiaceae bacterium]